MAAHLDLFLLSLLSFFSAAITAFKKGYANSRGRMKGLSWCSHHKKPFLENTKLAGLLICLKAPLCPSVAIMQIKMQFLNFVPLCLCASVPLCLLFTKQTQTNPKYSPKNSDFSQAPPFSAQKSMIPSLKKMQNKANLLYENSILGI